MLKKALLSSKATFLNTPHKYISFDIIKRNFEPYKKLGRYQNQTGTLLLYLPCAIGVGAGWDGCCFEEVIFYNACFYFGALCMRAAGCAINDIWDRDFDKNVERTKQRPIAAGELTIKQAFTFALVNCAGGLLVLSQLNYHAIVLSFSVVPGVVIYPLMKRVTNYPQLMLGIVFNWGILVAYAALTNTYGSLDLIPLYLSSILWTLVYDTVYAHQDKEDDVKIGVKSTALAWGDNNKIIMQTFLVSIAILLAAYGWLKDFSPSYYCSAAFMSGIAMASLSKIDLSNKNECSKFFKNSKYFNLGLALIITYNAAKKNKKNESKN